MKYCQECGTEITDGAASFCPKCRKNATVKDEKKKKSSGGKYTKNKKNATKKDKPHKKKRKKTSKRKEADIPEIMGEPVDDGYDGYYDDILPPDQDHVKEGIDKTLVKKIIIVAVVVTLIISLCVAMLYVL